MDLSIALEGNPRHKRALVDLHRVGGSMSVAEFDEVNKPYGELLRRDLCPHYIREENGNIFLSPIIETEANKW